MEELKNTYRKSYRIRINTPGRKSYRVVFPYEVLEMEARKHGMEIPEFLEKYQAVAHFNGFDGVYYKFEEI